MGFDQLSFLIKDRDQELLDNVIRLCGSVHNVELQGVEVRRLVDLFIFESLLVMCLEVFVDCGLNFFLVHCDPHFLLLLLLRRYVVVVSLASF